MLEEALPDQCEKQQPRRRQVLEKAFFFLSFFFYQRKKTTLGAGSVGEGIARSVDLPSPTPNPPQLPTPH